MDPHYSQRDPQGDLQRIRQTFLFKDLPEPVVTQAISQVVSRSHPANQVILLENDWGSSVYFILEGWVKIRTYNLDGKEVTLNILGRGNYLGKWRPWRKFPESTDVITLVPTVISSIPATDFVKLLNSEPLAGIHLAQLMARRLRQVNRRLRLRESRQYLPGGGCVAISGGRSRQNRLGGIEIPNLPHRELSSLSGLARETVTRVISKLEKKGLLIREKEAMVLPDIDALEQLLV
jgi:CRP-like cAMP-binding protein